MNEQVAVIIGGAGAIGRASALELANRGMSCVLNGMTQDTLEESASLLADVGVRAVVVQGDAGSEDVVKRVFAACDEEFGSCDALVHAAAIQGPTAAVGDIGLAEWDQVLRVNLTSAFLCAREALSRMIPRRSGSVIFLSSADAVRGFPMTSPYASSKAALIGLARALSAEAKIHGVRVNVLSPGPVPEAAIFQTAMKGMAGQLSLAPGEVMESVLGSVQGGRDIDAAAIAHGVAFLAGPDSSVMTGQVLVMDSVPG
jgi:NAD(P)-dependent dehydrogenase (short-subunit alcohol dehydrogenase family)